MILEACASHPVVSLVVALFALVVATRLDRAWRYRRVPGPFLARFTGLMVLSHAWTDDRTGWIHRLHARYGPVVLVAPDEVHFNSRSARKVIYGRLDKHPVYAVYASYGERNLFSTLEEERHARRRRQVGNHYAGSRLPVETVETEVRLFCRSLRGRVEIYSGISRLTLDVVTSVVFGSHLPIDMADIRRDILGRGGRNRARLLEQCGHPMLARGLDLISSWRRKSESIDVITQIMDNAKKGGLFTILQTTGERSALSETRDHLIAGSDTTTTVLVFLLHHLAGNATLQDELHRSLDGGREDVLEAVLKEALRLWAPIPMTLPRVSRTEMEIDGFKIPAKSKIGCQAYSLHRLPHLFPDPEVFRHDRFLLCPDEKNSDEIDLAIRPDREEREEEVRRREDAIWAFGSGTRVCLGKQLAMLEMRLVVTNVVKRFSLSLPDRERRVEMIENVEAFGAGPGHQPDIYISFEPRLFSPS